MFEQENKYLKKGINLDPADKVWKKLLKLGVSRVYTPKNYDINSIMTDFAGILEKNYS